MKLLQRDTASSDGEEKVLRVDLKLGRRLAHGGYPGRTRGVDLHKVSGT